MAPVRDVLRETALKYPHSLVQAQLNDLAKVEFHIKLLTRAVGRSAVVCDVGGGVGLFSAACAALGMRVTLVDEFQHQSAGDTLQLHRGVGVTVVSRDVTRHLPAFPPNCFDAIVAFDAGDLCHAAPERQLHALLQSLRPGGAFILGVTRSEASMATLRFIAKDLALRRIRVFGRNWLVHRYSFGFADHLLRLLPPLYANLYLTGHK